MSLDRIRTDVVGSLLRPADWKQARLAFETGKMPAAAFASIELDCIKSHLALQEQLGLDVVTDGEISRLNYQDSFGLAVTGYDAGAETVKSQEQRAGRSRLPTTSVRMRSSSLISPAARRPLSRRARSAPCRLS